MEKGLQGTEIKTTVIYGNGGVFGLAFHVLETLGIKATMVGRSPERVTQKKKELGIEDAKHFEVPYDLEMPRLFLQTQIFYKPPILRIYLKVVV